MKKYYICRNHSGMKGLTFWWEKNDYGYSSSISEARVFTEEDIKDRHSRIPEKIRNKIAYEIDYIYSICDPGGTVEAEKIDAKRGFLV